MDVNFQGCGRGRGGGVYSEHVETDRNYVVVNGCSVVMIGKITASVTLPYQHTVITILSDVISHGRHVEWWSKDIGQHGESFYQHLVVLCHAVLPLRLIICYMVSVLPHSVKDLDMYQ